MNEQVHKRDNHPASENLGERNTQVKKRDDLVKSDGQQRRKMGDTDS